MNTMEKKRLHTKWSEWLNTSNKSTHLNEREKKIERHMNDIMKSTTKKDRTNLNDTQVGLVKVNMSYA